MTEHPLKHHSGEWLVMVPPPVSVLCMRIRNNRASAGSQDAAS